MDENKEEKKPKVVVLTGIQGVGKTTLLKELKEVYGDKVIVYPETASSKIFEMLAEVDVKKNYKDFQETFLIDKEAIEDMLDDGTRHNPDKIHILDRDTRDVTLFSLQMHYDGLITEKTYHDIVYRQENGSRYNFFESCDYKTILLSNVTPKKCLERIKNRNRDGESEVTVQYLRGLHDLFRRYFSAQENTYVIKKSTDNNLNLVKNIIFS